MTYAATLDVPRHIVEFLSRLLARHRRRLRTPRGSRALGPFRQALLVLRWFRERGCIRCLARDAGISQATGYRYLHQGIDVLADQAPTLHEVLTHCQASGTTHLVLDGTLIECDRVAGARENGNDRWFSQKHKACDGTVRFLSAPDGTPLWVSEVEPGSVPDITAARPCPARLVQGGQGMGLPTLADKGCIGSGIGIHVPVRRPRGRSEQALHVDTHMRNALIRHVRALGERTAAELKERGRALKHVTLSPSRTGDIARDALVLNGQWKRSPLREPHWLARSSQGSADEPASAPGGSGGRRLSS